jgi:RNA polymerase sigma-32 factor
MTQVWSYPKLSREKEQELARRWRDRGDRRAANQLVCAALRHVVPVALRYRRSGEPLSDLIAEGNLALMHALNKFDPDRQVRFVTYANFWVRAYLTRYVRRCRSMVSSVVHEQAALYAKIRAERSRLASSVNDSEKAERLIAKKLSIDLETLREVEHRFSGRDVSLDAPAREDGMVPEKDMLVAEQRDPSQEAMLQEMRTLLREAVEASDLEPRERFVVEQRLLAEPGAEPSLAEIGRRLNVTREWARQLERRAMRKVEKELETVRTLAEAV